MSTYEIRTAGPLAIRVEADDEADALDQAVSAELVVDGETGSVLPADELPIGADGDDPEATPR